ncbi:MAG: YlmC/YmxH family sporulation protein [Clostridiales bacterium]|nr:YlmC/YmxH family sporulation protein [Clostridiales bacterium]MCF8021348.1 YlmC/YmxH family sporulation protein [Clostridiales bacterium]
MVKISDLRMREVINIVDGKRLGPIKDIDIDVVEGKLHSMVLPGHQAKFMGLVGKEEEIIVPWDKIVRIGIDVILVDLSFNDQNSQEKGASLHRGDVW